LPLLVIFQNTREKVLKILTSSILLIFNGIQCAIGITI